MRPRNYIAQLEPLSEVSGIDRGWGGSAEGWASPSSVIPSPHPTPHPRGSGLILTSELQQGFEKQKTQKGRKEERQKAAGNSGI